MKRRRENSCLSELQWGVFNFIAPLGQLGMTALCILTPGPESHAHTALSKQLTLMSTPRQVEGFGNYTKKKTLSGFCLLTDGSESDAVQRYHSHYTTPLILAAVRGPFLFGLNNCLFHSEPRWRWSDDEQESEKTPTTSFFVPSELLLSDTTDELTEWLERPALLLWLQHEDLVLTLKMHGHTSS